MKIVNETITLHGLKWLIIEARSIEDAEGAIDIAAVRGSVGGKTVEVRSGVEQIMAHVKRVD